MFVISHFCRHAHRQFPRACHGSLMICGMLSFPNYLWPPGHQESSDLTHSGSCARNLDVQHFLCTVRPEWMDALKIIFIYYKYSTRFFVFKSFIVHNGNYVALTYTAVIRKKIVSAIRVPLCLLTCGTMPLFFQKHSIFSVIIKNTAWVRHILCVLLMILDILSWCLA